MGGHPSREAVMPVTVAVLLVRRNRAAAVSRPAASTDRRAVEVARRTVRSVLAEQPGQHRAELSVTARAEPAGDVVLEALDRDPARFDAPFALAGQHDQLGPTIRRVGAAYDVAEGLE